MGQVHLPLLRQSTYPLSPPIGRRLADLRPRLCFGAAMGSNLGSASRAVYSKKAPEPDLPSNPISRRASSCSRASERRGRARSGEVTRMHFLWRKGCGCIPEALQLETDPLQFGSQVEKDFFHPVLEEERWMEPSAWRASFLRWSAFCPHPFHELVCRLGIVFRLLDFQSIFCSFFC